MFKEFESEKYDIYGNLKQNFDSNPENNLNLTCSKIVEFKTIVSLR